MSEVKAPRWFHAAMAPPPPPTPQWFREAMSVDEPAPWTTARIAVSACTLGALWWLFSFDPVESFPKFGANLAPQLLREGDQLSTHRAAATLRATSAGVVVGGGPRFEPRDTIDPIDAFDYLDELTA